MRQVAGAVSVAMIVAMVDMSFGCASHDGSSLNLSASEWIVVFELNRVGG